MTTFYDLSAQNIRGEDIAMADFTGKVVLVVNTASECGFTPQYQGLQDLYAKFQDKGLVILGFPCNQFGGQEPGENDTIEQACQINYGVEFPMFAKVDVNGANSHPVFQYLAKALPGTFGSKVKWNFTKFLIGRNGKPMKRYAPTKKPASMEADIVRALAK
ncbi:glutathione peroxidase [Photobacterium sanguinicancri]|uniref:Glutathione peroxidase n=1 Tax=Photobacterium sanguinicancri TaxID=875932 RepID=A0AAW7XYS0_9GAMM|nr:glutathione peroxidase [Photobacterium sanguinicancri]KXI21195.1 glutathione peroxidase [Photobacterium sanguinicancri]MDO6498383.1 glutathione peroxidase [Photobacterium sanguinicancri]MDO6541461.1 glutathione peroxidase [Photobacterium sanguinicancri]